MIFLQLAIAGVYQVTIEPAADERGYFAPTFSSEEFGRRGMATDVAQTGYSLNKLRGTLRGLHFQTAPHEEAKLVRCIKGAILDVAVDLRRTSDTFCEWLAIDLTDDNLRMLYIPEGMAHGFITTTDDTIVGYQMSRPYAPLSARGVRWDDPAFDISWPLEPTLITKRDREYPDFTK